MDDDPQETSGPPEKPDQGRQNRRQFFNGLGKWSLAIIAAVAALREGLYDVRDSIGSRFGSGSEASGDLREQIARRPKPGHSDEPASHIDQHTHHAFHCNGPFRDRGCGGGGSPA
jgi:hypothetical protein